MEPNNLVVKKVVNAPVEKVWEAWTNPELVMKWWAPEGFTSPSAKIDFREGGVSIVSMRAPKEFSTEDMYSTWTYTKIIPKKSIEYIHNISDKDGNKIDPTKITMPADFPQDQKHLIEFNGTPDGKTEVTFTQFDWGTRSMRSMAEQGLNQSLNKMVAIFE